MWTKLLLVLVAIFLLAFVWLSPQYTDGYNASILDKTDRLLSLKGRKIVLIGNSNVAMGMRCPLIEKAFDYRAVNLGIHGGLGNEFQENIAKLNVREGDIYVLLHSAFSEEEDPYINPMLIWITIENHFHLWRCVPPKLWHKMAVAAPTYVRNCALLEFEQWRTGPFPPKKDGYRRGAFNSYGDNVFSHEFHMDPRFTEDYTSPVPAISEKTARRLNRLNQYFASRGARLFVAGYPIAYKEGHADKEAFAAFQGKLQSYLDFPVISNYADYLFPYEYFYDTNLHLSDTGSIARTKQLIEDLRPFIPKELQKQTASF